MVNVVNVYFIHIMHFAVFFMVNSVLSCYRGNVYASVGVIWTLAIMDKWIIFYEIYYTMDMCYVPSQSLTAYNILMVRGLAGYGKVD